MSGVYVSLDSLSKARSIYLNQERQRARLAASACHALMVEHR